MDAKLIGTVLNVLSICTFSQRTLRKKPIAFLCIILNVTDTLSLYLGALEEWLRQITNSPLKATNNLSCRIYNYILYIVASLPGWVLSVIAFERVISMAKPLKLEAALLCSQINVSKVLLLLFLQFVSFIVLIYSILDWDTTLFKIIQKFKMMICANTLLLHPLLSDRPELFLR